MGDDAFGRAPVGSGAYKFVSWTAGDNITVERNDEYWRDKSILKTIKFRIITEAASRTIDLESGGVDITLGLPTTDADRIEENPDTQLIVSTGATDRYIAFNCQKDVFKDKRVRQALNYATDKNPSVWYATERIPQKLWTVWFQAHFQDIFLLLNSTIMTLKKRRSF